MKTFKERVAEVRKQFVDVWADKDRARANRRYDAIVSQTKGAFLAAPEILQAVADISPSDTDLFDVARFFRARKNEQILDGVIKQNSAGYAPFINAAQSVWSALIATEAAPQAVTGDTPNWFPTHDKVMRAMMELPEFKTLRERTAGSSLFTSAAMHTILPVVRKLIDEELPPPQPDNNGDDNRDGDDDQEGDGQDNPQQDNPQQDNPQQDNPQQDNGKPKPKEQPSDGRSDAQKQKDMQNRLRQAMNKAADDNKKADESMKSCGVEPPTDADMDPSQYMQMVKEFQQNDGIKRLVNMIGRLGRIARAKAKRIIPGFAGYGINRYLGDELGRVPDYKVAELGTPALRKSFLLDMCGCELPQVTEHDNAPPGRGPVVVMTDESGSMQDGQHLIAKALSVASIRTANEHGRKAWAVSFSSDARFYDTSKPNELVKFMRSNMSGGTDFDKPLALGIKHINGCPQAKQADIMLLTDGECDLSVEFANDFAKWKHRTGARLFAVMIGNGGYSYGDKSNLRKVADYYLNVKNLTSEQDATKAFAEFWSRVSDSPVSHEDLAAREKAAQEEAEAAGTTQVLADAV